MINVQYLVIEEMVCHKCDGAGEVYKGEGSDPRAYLLCPCLSCGGNGVIRSEIALAEALRNLRITFAEAGDGEVTASAHTLIEWAELDALRAVAAAVWALARQWEEEDAGGQPLGWLIDALADALDVLDGGGNQVGGGQAESPWAERYQRRFARWEAELIKNLKAVSAGEVVLADVGRRIADALDALDKEE